ncbi:uncharacterized protein TNCV_321911 [Trichonephila clavipes]|nr:uncharacterized protein TNCV_321911 [Trichonephila clavipes]
MDQIDAFPEHISTTVMPVMLPEKPDALEYAARQGHVRTCIIYQEPNAKRVFVLFCKDHWYQKKTLLDNFKRAILEAVVFSPFTRRRTVLPSVMFRGARKEELILVADELGEEITPEMREIDLKNLILDSDKYKNNKEFIDDYLDSIISDRKSKEEQARVTAESQLEFERINLEKVKLEIELGKINLERAKLENQRDSNELQRTNPETKQTSIENFILSVRTLTLPIPKKTRGVEFIFLFFRTFI